jgi:alkylated DNA repair dioxygenase AlkB
MGEIVATDSVPDSDELDKDELYHPFTAKGANFYHRRRFLGYLADRAFDVLGYGGEAGIRWSQGRVHVYGYKTENRMTAFYGEPGATYQYSGRSLEAIPWSDDPTCMLSSIKRLVEEATGERFNCCLLNLYRNGGDAIGPHSDNESSLVPGSAIAAVSLGATREFWVEPKPASAAIPLRPAMFPATHGSLVVMSGNAQRSFVHWVPVDRKVAIPRISLTFRHARIRGGRDGRGVRC